MPTKRHLTRWPGKTVITVATLTMLHSFQPSPRNRRQVKSSQWTINSPPITLHAAVTVVDTHIFLSEVDWQVDRVYSSQSVDWQRFSRLSQSMGRQVSRLTPGLSPITPVWPIYSLATAERITLLIKINSALWVWATVRTIFLLLLDGQTVLRLPDILVRLAIQAILLPERGDKTWCNLTC